MQPDKLLPSADRIPERFEFGTLPYELLAGTTAAVEFLASIGSSDGDSRRQRLDDSIGAVEAHEERLRLLIETRLAALPGVTTYSKAPRRTPTLLVGFEGVAARDVAARLADAGVNAPAGSFYALEASRVLGLGDGGALRIGLAPYNDESDVDRLMTLLTDVAMRGAA